MVRKDGGWGSPRHPSEFAPSLKHLLVKTYFVCMFWLHLFSWQKIQIWSSLVKKSLSSAPISTEVSKVNMTLSNVSLDLSASNDHCTLQSLFLWLISWQYCYVLVHQPKALRTLDMYEVVTLTSKTRNSLSILRLAKLIDCCDGATCQCTFYESLLTSSEICCCLAVLLGPEHLYCYTVSQTWRLTV